jgi:hypothetical protein
MNLDDLRAAETGRAIDPAASFDPLAWFVGPVRLRIGDESRPPRVADLNKYIDREKKTVRSRTGELTWDWGNGVAIADAPESQSVCGFLAKAGPVELADVVFHLGVPYGVAWAVSLDGRPIGVSRRTLLQVITEERSRGWETQPATFEAKGKTYEGFRILATGKGGMQVRAIEGSVTIKRADADKLRVTALDTDFRLRRVLPAGDRIELLPDCLYYLIEPN